jgi:thiol:disulfide interchange protein DsbC
MHRNDRTRGRAGWRIIFLLAALIGVAGAASAQSPPQAPTGTPATPAAPTAPPAPAAAAPSAAPANEPPVSAEYADLAKKLAKLLGDVQIRSIRPSGVDGIVEVLVSGNQIIYSDLSGRHIFNGHLLDADTRQDLTEERLSEVTRIDPKQLPLADAFDVKRGTGKRVLYLFEDPDCPYCRKLEEVLPKVNDVTLHVFLYPLVSIHPHANEHAVSVWCAKDRQKAWLDKMLKGIDPAPAKCDNPIERNVALGDKLHIDGTPTLIFADGRVHAGTVTAEELERLLAAGS